MKKLLLIMAILLGITYCCFQAHAASIVSTGHQKYNYKEYLSDLAALQKKYPDYLQYKVIGSSADGRKLHDVVVGNPDAKKHLIVIANLHAREYITTQLTMAQIEYICKNYKKKINKKKVSSTLDKVAIHFIPSADPDGTAISQYGFGAIRSKSWRNKMKRTGASSTTWKANARGVDLNRNWPISWAAGGSRGAMGYRGPSAASEPEVKAIIKDVNKIQKKGKIIGLISYHSMGCILYGRCASQATSSVRSKTTRMYQLAQKLTGYRLMPTESISSAKGCSREYFLYKRHIPCITLEVGSSASPVPISQFPSIWRKNKDIPIREAQILS